MTRTPCNPDKPWIEPALDLVIDAIDQGSPLRLTPEVADLYRDRYCVSFAKNEEYQWNRDRARVLVLARVVGALAAAMTALKAAGTFQIPEDLDKDCADRAGYMVAHMKYCPIQSGLGPDGIWCDQYEPRRGVLFKLLVWILRFFVRRL